MTDDLETTARRLGVVESRAEFERLVETATKLARITGDDATKAVEDLVVALARRANPKD